MTKLVRVCNLARGKKLIISSGDYEQFLRSVKTKFQVETDNDIILEDDHGAEVDEEVFPILLDQGIIPAITFKIVGEDAASDGSYTPQCQQIYYINSPAPISPQSPATPASPQGEDYFKQALESYIERKPDLKELVSNCNAERLVDSAAATKLINDFVSVLIDLRGDLPSTSDQLRFAKAIIEIIPCWKYPDSIDGIQDGHVQIAADDIAIAELNSSLPEDEVRRLMIQTLEHRNYLRGTNENSVLRVYRKFLECGFLVHILLRALAVMKASKTQYPQEMSLNICIFVLFPILQQVFPTILGNYGTVFRKAVASDQAIADLISVNFPAYLHTFENCATIIFSGNELVWGGNEPSFGSTVLMDYYTGSMIYDKIALHRRRNKAQHCWATFLILPEEWGMLGMDIHYFLDLRCFVYPNYSPQFFVLFTARAPLMKQYLVRDDSSPAYFGMREFLIVDATKVGESEIGLGESEKILRMAYHNIYYVKIAPVGLGLSEEWYNLECLPMDCFDELVLLGKNVSRLNKYFWGSDTLSAQAMGNTRDSIGQDRVGSPYQSRDRHITNLTSFNGFLDYWILQDVLFNVTTNLTAIHYMSGIQSWACLGICFTTIVFVLTAVVHRKLISDSIYLVVGITIENSVLVSNSNYKAKIKGKKYRLAGLYMIIAVWTLLVGTILTNWYKTTFTMEMIVPTIYKSPWSESARLAGQDGKYKRLAGYKKTAIKLRKMILPHLGVGEGGKYLKNGTFSWEGFSNGLPPFEKRVLEEIPI
ncbi:hypothetical protein Fcan01_27316 [Folsomia candida]|uniref:Uncharacterized protein n=1 Tax=Folsomia candida TaxID=158441 RepID=A0A226CY83_FOLCA|nr:hypothetical protein Fcan01_27316 [Folsomia candida]